MPQHTDLVDVTAAAILASRGFTPAEIAKQLSVSVATISRRLKNAREAKLLSDLRPEFHEDAVSSKEVLQHAKLRVDDVELRTELVRALEALPKNGKAVPRFVQVVPSTRVSLGDAEYQAQLRAVARLAALRLTDLLAPGFRLGVTFGRAVRYVLDALATIYGAGPHLKVAVFPTIGSIPYRLPHMNQPFPISDMSSAIARDMQRFLAGAETDTQISLQSIPAFLPKSLERARDAFVEYCSIQPAYQAVFGGPGLPAPLIETADLIVTGAGDMPAPDTKGSPYLRSRLELEGLTLDEIARLSVGDIAGVFLPRPGLSGKEQKRLQEINERGLGLRLGHLQAQTKRALTGRGKGGVLLMAHGQAKAPLVLEAVRMGATSDLIVDGVLARALVERQRQKKTRR